MPDLTRPLDPKGIVLELAFWHGRAFAAPIGTVGARNDDAWRPVTSLEELAEFLNVDLTPEVP